MSGQDCAILGMGYLGRPLAEKLHESGREVAALKRYITSDDVNLPIALDSVDLNQHALRDLNIWQTWRNKPVWICLLPPSALADYTGVLSSWLALAREYGVTHVIYGSSTSVYGNEERLCHEDTPLAPTGSSAEKVCAAEQLFLNSGMANIDILRFGGLYSAARHPLTSLLKRRNIAGAHQPVNMLHQDRAVAALVQAADSPAGVRIRNIVENSHPSKYLFYAQEARKLGLPAADFDMDDHQTGKTVISRFDDFAAVCRLDTTDYPAG